MRNWDPTCQMKEIGCVIGEENIWANIQPHGDPSLMDFNIDNTMAWKPFLNPKIKETYFLDRVRTIQP